MKTKNEVYVVIDTAKKARKVKALLDMMGEDYSKGCFGYDEFYNKVHFHDTHREFWISSNGLSLHKVSIKELRNILAVEKLKEGDFVVMEITGTKYIVEFDYNRNGKFFGKKWICKHCDGELSSINKGGCFDNFIRYATEEERVLFEPKPKELEVGKWYKTDSYPNFLSIHLQSGRYGLIIVIYHC